MVDKNTTAEKRYASIKIAPVDNDFLNYTVKLVQVYEGYVHEDDTELPNTSEEDSNVSFGQETDGGTR